jgi:hypothetical protein
MPDSNVSFPNPEPGDPEEVVVALETATALWARGDAREALRWLRRAAETAGDAGSDLRAVTLARSAADITTRLQIAPSVPPEQAPSNGAAAPRESDAPSTKASPAPPRARQALRVAVQASELERNVLRAVVLAEGEAPPDGMHEALLVAVDPSAHLLGRRRRDA